MGKLQDFRVEFDKQGATYAPGEMVTGKVVLILNGSKNLREIRMEAKGEATVHWSRSHTMKDSSGRTRRRTRHYQGNEHYFSVTNRLVGSGDGQTTLPAGQHSYHFSFQLPLNIPCSIEHEYGHVRYTVKAILDRPWRFDHKIVAAFTVVGPYDLNSQPNLITGIDDEIKRKFCLCCMLNRGSMKVNVKSRVQGFVPGETIDLIVNYNNTSSHVHITKIKLKLQKKLEFRASQPLPDKRNSNEIVKKTKYNGPFPNNGEITLKIEVPSLPPSRLDFCSIIDVSYNLILTIHVSGLHFKVTRKYPIDIGTIPLHYRNSTESTSHNLVNPTVPSAPSIEQISPIVPQMPQAGAPIGFVVVGVPSYVPANTSIGTPKSIPEMPPPSYEECISGSHTIVDQNEQGIYGSNVQFTPKYPVYKFPMPMPYPP